MVDNSGSLLPGSERNRKFAEELERKAGLGRKPVSHRIGDVGQGGARSFAAALPGRSPTLAGRVGKRPGALRSSGGMAGRLGQSTRSSAQANTALKKAQSMLRETERELALIKRNKATKISQVKMVRNNTRGGAARGRGGARGGGGRGGRGAGRGGRGGRGGGGGAGAGRGKPKSQDALDAELDGYMLGTKAGLDKQMEDYMSSTKNGLDKQMEDYMAQKEASA